MDKGRVLGLKGHFRLHLQKALFCCRDKRNLGWPFNSLIIIIFIIVVVISILLLTDTKIACLIGLELRGREMILQSARKKGKTWPIVVHREGEMGGPTLLSPNTASLLSAIEFTPFSKIQL